MSGMEFNELYALIMLLVFKFILCLLEIFDRPNKERGWMELGFILVVTVLLNRAGIL